MARTVKIWCLDDETEPQEEVSHIVKELPNWFREEPEIAAELYALERGPDKDSFSEKVFRLCILDEEGTRHEFTTKVRYRLSATVSKVDNTRQI
jgi:hypothetical protein